LPKPTHGPKISTNIHNDKILILDFGAQYTQLIARRECASFGVYCEIWAWDHDPAEIAAFGARGIILSGGPESTTEAGRPRAPQQVFDVGIADARHLLRHADHGGAAGWHGRAADAREFGYAEVEVVARPPARWPERSSRARHRASTCG
jgi:GMP synthase (glutamine-hydrolysing)